MRKLLAVVPIKSFFRGIQFERGALPRFTAREMALKAARLVLRSRKGIWGGFVKAAQEAAT